MKEVWEIIVEKYFSFGRSVSSNQLARVKVRNAIANLCDEYLTSPDMVLKFEILPSSLPYAVEVLSDETLTSKYVLQQVSESCFEARLLSLGVFE